MMKSIVSKTPIVYRNLNVISPQFRTFTSFKDIGDKNYLDTINALGSKNINASQVQLYRSVFETDISVFKLQVDTQKLKLHEYNSIVNYSKFLMDKERNGEYLVPYGKTFIFGSFIIGCNSPLLLFPFKWMYEYHFYSRRNPDKRQYIHKHLLDNIKTLVDNNEDTN